MANHDETNRREEDKVKKESVESKHKNASDHFLKFMKKSREDERKKSSSPKKETTVKPDPALGVSNFVSDVSIVFSKVLNKINMWIDAMLASSQRIRVLSLFIALILCYFVNGGTGITTTKSIDYIDQVPVQVLAADGYEVSGAADFVTVQLIGDYASIQWAKVMKNFSVILDAQDKTSGNYEISYTAEGFSSTLDVKIIPESAQVNVSEKQTRSFALGYSFVKQQEMDAAYTLKEPLLAFLEVEVTAGETTLNEIDRVVAKIDVSKVTQSIVNGEAPIVALDSNGNELPVSIDQPTVRFDLEVVSFSKIVPIRLEVRGDVDSQYVLTSMIPSITQVTIYGLEENLKDIQEVVAYVDVDGKNSDTTISGVALTLPENVTKLSERAISVELKLEDKITSEIKDIPITFESLPSDLEAKFLAETTTSIKVTGAKSKIKSLNNSNIKIYIDLSEATAGTGEYPLKIANQDATISYEWLDIDRVDVAISKRS